MPNLFSDLTSSTLKKSMDVAGLRQRVIADNIANVETPGFKRSEVSFEGELSRALDTGSDLDAQDNVERTEPELSVDRDTPAGVNGNNVSMDKEMASLTKNTVKYEALVQLLEMKGGMIRTAISEGRR